VKFYNVQALRAVAAYCVVGHHVIDTLNFYIASINSPLMVFHSGVDIFFVISGFVMALTTARGHVAPGHFIRSRLARIVPIYWLLTFVAGMALLAGFRIFGWPGFSLRQFIDSFLFFPTFDAAGNYVKPILFVGWSLICEMMFYILFALSLCLRGEGRQRIALYALLAAVAATNLLADVPVLSVFRLPYLLEFGAGVAIFQVTRRWTLPPGAAWAAIAVAIAVIAGSVTLPPPYQGSITFAAPAALIVLAAVSLERHGVVFDNPILQYQGNASYSLYLTHIFVFQAAGKISVGTGLNQSVLGLLLTVVLTVLTCIVVATLFHRHVETPLNQAAARMLGVGRVAGRAPAGAVPQADPRGPLSLPVGQPPIQP
jgi:peptidoglycan/LPS O-acetylase OafA/YrhL